MNQEHRQRVLRYAKSLLGPEAEGMGGLESMAARPALADSDLETVDRVLRDQSLEFDTGHLEAIIFPKLRPVFEIRANGYRDLPRPWQAMNAPEARKRLETAIRAIGRVDVLGHPQLAYGGTGFLVGRNLLMTNRHVAAIFTEGLGTKNLTLTFRSRVDLRQEVESEETHFLKVLRTCLIHPYWDAAVVEVTGVPDDLQHLTLSAESMGDGRMVAVVGYPAFDPRNNPQVQLDVFKNLFEKKRLQPGYLTGEGTVFSYGREVAAATHDASTLGGNSGSAVIDVETGQVIGLHFAGLYLDTNFAVPSWELALDAKVVDLGVHFTKPAKPPATPKPAWLKVWDAIEAPTAVAPVGVSQPPAASLSGSATCAEQECTWTIPVHVTVRVGTPVRMTAVGPAPAAGARTPLDELRESRRSFLEDSAAYYPEAEDRAAAETYYSGIRPASASLFGDLSQLVRSTHRTVLPYRPTVHLYPLVDLHPDGDLVSIYSEQPMNPEQLIRLEAPVEEAMEALMASGAAAEAIAGLEAIRSNSAEHVVPQSWFGQRQPMKGDLHHLFACESRCNSFRSNTPYGEFGPEEAVMEDCGRSERNENKFEPKGGKGAVARATLYFLLRYPGEVNRNSREYTADRIATLLRWHRENPVSLYERHRNREIFRKQGNRNPLIDHPEWAERADFRMGLGR